MRASTLIVVVAVIVGSLLAIVHPNGKILSVSKTSGAEATGTVAMPGGSRSIAANPDHGVLLAYDRERRVRHSGASTWHPVQISEAHALKAIGGGEMTVLAPNGNSIHLKYARHLEHPDGNWTWVGREDDKGRGTEAVITFGEKAVFGVIRQADSDLKITTEGGSTWLVETDYGRVVPDRLAANDDDFVVPAEFPQPSSRVGLIPAAKGAVEDMVRAAADSAAVSATGLITVDVAMGFTSGFAARLGGESQARTRLSYLIDVTNQAYQTSGVNAEIRLVHAVQLNYPDATHNRTALFDLTGVDCTTQTDGPYYLSDRRVACTPVAQSPALQPLTAARNTYGADLLVLVRKFESPEQASCGSAWMLGGGQNPIDASSASFGVALVSDSSADMFPDEGATCPEVMLAHELGHNMGQQHDLVTAMGSDDSDNNGNLLDPEEYGRHAYSFGYSTDGTSADIATIMSNRRLSQTRYRVFASPQLSACGGAPCGVADQADNVRSMNEVMPAIAAFRPTMVSPSGGLAGDIDGDNKDDVLWFNSTTEELYYWLMDGGTLRLRRGAGHTPVGATPRALADVNNDGRSDILIASGQDIWIYLGNNSGAFTSAYLAQYPAGWDLVGMADIDADGKADVVWHHPTTRELYYWLLDGAAIRLRRGGVTTPAGTAPRLGDLNGDGRADVLLPSAGDFWVYNGNASGSFTSSYVASYPGGWNLVGAQDVDADGKADLMWHHPATGELYYWLMDGGAIRLGRGGVTVPSGTAPRVLADFNGDGRADVFLPSSEHIWTYQGNPSGTFTSFYTAPYPIGWY